MTTEIRFNTTLQLKQRHEKLVQLLGRKTSELARSLYLSGLEKMENELLKGRFPVFVPVRNERGILRLKFEDEEDLNN